jgi:8-oxo-dGTP pyrophosphatase MutT (NUDIX family)
MPSVTAPVAMQIPPTAPWPALQAAQHRPAARLPVLLAQTAAGSVQMSHLPVLSRWPQWLQLHEDAVHMALPDAPPARDAALAEIHQQLRAEGLIRAWRDETFGWLEPSSGAVLAHMERAACRFWGSLTRGAHCNGFVADADGRPTHLWIARRAWSKATDPGKLDNLVGGGVPVDQTPHEALLREAWEEAGLRRELALQATPGRVIRINCDVPEGRMVEDIHVYDLQLPPGLQPQNQDGEVAELHCLPIAQALRCAAEGQMTTDAALVTLDFLLRHQLLAEAEATVLGSALAPLLAHAV